MKFVLPLILAMMLAFVMQPVAAHAETPASVCAQHATDDTLRPVPESLAGAVNRVFGTSMPASLAAATTVYRCDNGQVQLCTAGANLPCGKADTSRTPNTGAQDWCRQNPDASFIPAFATGHDSIFDWRCQSGAPQITRQVFNVDPRGFVAQFWKPLP